MVSRRRCNQERISIHHAQPSRRAPLVVTHKSGEQVASAYDTFNAIQIGSGMTGTVKKVQHRATGRWYAWVGRR